MFSSCVFYFVFLSCVVHLISQRHLFHNVSHVFSHHGRGYAQGVFPSPRNVHLSRLPCVFHVRHIGCSADGAVILPRIVRGKFLKRRILYVVNGSASFKQELLKIQLSGDVHPEPGPEIGSVNKTSNERLFSRRSTHKGISFFYANARSIGNKVDMLHMEVANKAYDVVVLVETHLDSSIADGEYFPANYLVFRRDRMCNGRRGGGVLIAVRDTFKSSLRDDMLSDSELIFVDISFPNDRKITVGAFYRPPNADTKPLLDMQDVLQDLVIIGDFNLPWIDWLDVRAACDSANNSLLIDIIQDNFFTQLVNEPTGECNILDLVLTTSPEFVR